MAISIEGQVPVDSLGVPYPVIPSNRFSRDKRASKAGRHHEFFPSDNPYFSSTLGGTALRYSRIVWVQHAVHHGGPRALHPKMDPPKPPETPSAEFRVINFSLAGYYPETGLDLWETEHQCRPMEEWERRILTRNNPEKPYGYNNLSESLQHIRPFFQEYVVGCDFKQANGSDELLRNFVTARGEHSYRRIGYEILELAVELSVKPFKNEYYDAHDRVLLHPAAPIDPREVVRKALGRSHILEELFPKLHEKAAAQLDELAQAA